MVRLGEFSPRRALTAAACAGAAGLALSTAKALTGWGISCPWRALTGTLCPFCGGTTLGVHLLHGEIGAAWTANPFVFVLLLGYVGAIFAWTCELLGGPEIRPPARLRSPALWWTVFGAAAVGFAVVRNLVS